MTFPRWTLVTGVLILPMVAAAAPKATEPAVAVYEEATNAFVAVSVSGSGFGAPAANSSIKIFEGGDLHVEIASTDADILVWQDDQIVAKTTDLHGPVKAKVKVGNKETKRVNADIYGLTR